MGGFSIIQKGDHHQFKHPDKPGKVTVPHPKKDLPVGTVPNIYRKAGWQMEVKTMKYPVVIHKDENSGLWRYVS